ncbi:ribonuclease P protein component [Paeniglutamicibacter psychrophenolicus]|uniref:ribonuclease P protein component n=1 Tax=Paeniglutamicibacter psychrophenolicus TaxID=257454 RepID=UPI0027D7B06E|nr:ribonuclease P protein component [Paeniglutamicibacter psychrophenolicus]
MLPKNQRLRLSQDFTATVRSGARTGRRNVVLYARVRSEEPQGDNRFGFIVSKAVGNAVHRNLVKRRMRALAQQFAAEAIGLDVVLRALPGSADIEWDELGQQVRSGLDSVVRKAGAKHEKGS